jgi:colicin import membrane protein
MKPDTIWRSAILLTMSLALGACAGPEPVARETPPPPVTSVAQADQQLAAVARERAAIEAGYAERERVCYSKFFTNNCLDEAKDRRRRALVAQRAIEVQAAHFKRQAVVEQRDRDMAEADKRFQAEEARLAAEPPKAAPVVAPLPAPRKPTAAARVAARDARLREAEQKEAAGAAKRAGNVRAYEQRKAESEERQRRVAQRKAEKAAKAAKEAEEKGKAK